MEFLAYSDIHFKNIIKDDATGEQLSFKVQINPDSFSRSFATKTLDNKKIRSDNSSGEGAGFDSEKYSFDLVFDGTGALGVASTGKAAELFKAFLNTVYAKKTDSSVKKEANFLEMHYCGETFYCKLSTLSAKYTLFGRDGSPLRIKASCAFISVDKDKPDPPPKKKKEKKPAPEIPPGTDNCRCVCTCDTYEETYSSAQSNMSVSIMTCNYTQQEMSR